MRLGPALRALSSPRRPGSPSVGPAPLGPAPRPCPAEAAGGHADPRRPGPQLLAVLSVPRPQLSAPPTGSPDFWPPVTPLQAPPSPPPSGPGPAFPAVRPEETACGRRRPCPALAWAPEPACGEPPGPAAGAAPSRRGLPAGTHTPRCMRDRPAALVCDDVPPNKVAISRTAGRLHPSFLGPGRLPTRVHAATRVVAFREHPGPSRVHMCAPSKPTSVRCTPCF